MLIRHNQLRLHRKRSWLSQGDIAYILRLGDYASVSRWEQGLKAPPLKLLILYHTLFEVPIEAFFERQKCELSGIVAERIARRIDELRAGKQRDRVHLRIASLSGILTRLANNHTSKS